MTKAGRYLSILAALLLALLPARAELTVNELVGFGAGGSGTPQGVSFRGCTGSSADLTTYTHTNVDIGPPAANRVIVLGIGGVDTTDSHFVSSATLAGNAMTVGAQELADFNAGGAFFVRAEPSGSTATITATWSTGVTSSAICVWAVYDIDVSTVLGRVIEGDPVSNAMTDTFQLSGVDQSLPVDARTFTICVNESDAATVVWLNMTERYDAAIAAASGAISAADAIVASAGNITTGCDPSGSGDTYMIGVAYGPS